MNTRRESRHLSQFILFCPFHSPRTSVLSGSAHQALVLDPVRPIGFDAQTLLPVRFVLRVVPVVPGHLALSFKGKHMRGDPVKEPAVVGDHHRTAGKVHKSLFQRAQGVHIEIIRRLIQQQDVGTFLQHLCQMHTVAFAAGERSVFFCWSVPLKLNRATYARELTSRFPSIRRSCPPEISFQMVFSGLSGRF